MRDNSQRINQTEPKKRKLSVREKRFVEEMANPNTKSQTEAAVRAGYSKNSARITASKLLTKANISEAIQERIQRVLKHHQVTPEEVLGSAVFQMRSSMDDLMDKDGFFDLKKARETGAIDLLKKHKETEKTLILKDGSIETTRTVEVELLTNQDARKEVANYIGLEKFESKVTNNWTDADLPKELYRRMVEKHGWSAKKAIAGIKGQFPEIDLNQLNVKLE